MRARIFQAVDAAAEIVLKGKFSGLDYLRSRPMGPAQPPTIGYGFDPVGVQGIAREILSRTREALSHSLIVVGKNYPPKPILVAEMNAFLAKKIIKDMGAK